MTLFLRVDSSDKIKISRRLAAPSIASYYRSRFARSLNRLGIVDIDIYKAEIYARSANVDTHRRSFREPCEPRRTRAPNYTSVGSVVRVTSRPRINYDS